MSEEVDPSTLTDEELDAAIAAKAAAEREDHGDETMRRGYARSRARDEAIRAALRPLPPGERTRALEVAAVVAVLLAIAVVVGALTTHDLRDKGGSLPFGLFLGVIFLVLAWGMWNSRYWAVLSFEAFLWFEVIVVTIALIVASTWTAFAVCVAVIALSGWMAWKLIRVMARIQAYDRQRAGLDILS
jgi:K+-sensing histidine kinase KdpD